MSEYFPTAETYDINRRETGTNQVFCLAPKKQPRFKFSYGKSVQITQQILKPGFFLGGQFGEEFP